MRMASTGCAASRFSASASSGSFSSRLRSARSAFPVHCGYLRADAARVDFWRARLGACNGRLRVGIAWLGGSLRSRQFTRSIGLTDWRSLLAQPGVDFVSLQYGDVASEIAQVRDQHHVMVRSFGDDIADIDELAAAITALDLVISVDTTVVHLAGALGHPVWVLLPSAPEWRYPCGGPTMPWYPSARLFRQTKPREWAAVISRVRDAVQQLAQVRDV